MNSKIEQKLLKENSLLRAQLDSLLSLFVSHLNNNHNISPNIIIKVFLEGTLSKLKDTYVDDPILSEFLSDQIKRDIESL